MPTRALHPCAQPRCGDLTSERYCAAHTHLGNQQRQNYERQRGSATHRLYGSRWRRYAKRFLLDHPLCHYCALNHRAVPSQCVDHATAHNGDERLFWDAANHRAACISCNTAKGASNEATFIARVQHRR